MSKHRADPPPPVGAPPRDGRPTLYVMVGLPAAGKTTEARRIERDHRALRLTLDEWWIPLFGASVVHPKRNVLEGRLVAVARKALERGLDVVLDFGVWARDERTALRWLASTVGAGCELVYVPVDEAEQRVRIDRRRAAAPESTFPMSRADLDEWRTIFQPPDDGELHGSALDPPPPGVGSWGAWIDDWWPTARR